MGTGFLLGDVKNCLTLIVVIGALLCDYAENHWMVHFPRWIAGHVNQQHPPFLGPLSPSSGARLCSSLPFGSWVLKECCDMTESGDIQIGVKYAIPNPSPDMYWDPTMGQVPFLVLNIQLVNKTEPPQKPLSWHLGSWHSSRGIRQQTCKSISTECVRWEWAGKKGDAVEETLREKGQSLWKTRVVSRWGGLEGERRPDHL